MRTEGSSIPSISKSVFLLRSKCYHSEAGSPMVKGRCFAIDSLGPNLVANTDMLMSFLPPLSNKWKGRSYLIGLLKTLNYIKHKRHLQKYKSRHFLLAMILRRITYFVIDSVFSLLTSKKSKAKCTAFLTFCDWI